MTKLEKLKEVNENLTNILAEMETEMFVKNISNKSKNVEVRKVTDKESAQNKIKNYL